MKKSTLLSTAKLFMYLASILLFIYGIAFRELKALDGAIMACWIGNILFGAGKPKDRGFFLALQVTFFAFLMGRTVSDFFMPGKSAYSIPDDVLHHTKVCLYIALSSLGLSYTLFEKIKFVSRKSDPYKTLQAQSNKNAVDPDEKYNSKFYITVRNIAKYLSYFTFIFAALLVISKAGQIFMYGYANSYLETSTNLPYLIVKLGDAYPVCFFLFLATMPSKKEVKIPVLLYLLNGILSLGTGKRSDFVVPILIILLYYLVRNQVNSGGSPWLTKKMMIVIGIATPFLLAFLFSWNYIRLGLGSGSSYAVTEQTSFFEKLIGFFDELGFSSNIISFGKMYEPQIPNKLYSIGETLDYLRENIVTQAIVKLPVYRGQTVERALNSTNFSQLITYLRSSSYYLSGRGLGSSYIAEAYHDFGYFGIVLWSWIYSAVLYFGYNFKNKGIIYITISLCALKYILIAPRNVASGFLTIWINLDIWLVVGLIYLIAKYLRVKKVVIT